MKRFVLLVLVMLSVALGVPSCGLWATAKPVMRTIFDGAVDLCALSPFAASQSKKAELSVKEWCAIAENVRPFVDAILSAQASAEKASVSRQAAQQCAREVRDGGGD